MNAPQQTIVLALAVLLSACTTIRAPQSDRQITTSEADTAWRNVLQKYVNDSGQVAFGRIAANSAELEVFVNYIEQVSPKSRPDLFKTREARLAYYLNSYNALAMYNVCKHYRAGLNNSLTGLGRVQFFYLRNFIIGGESISLYDYEKKVIRAEGDERVHFALNCMSRGCPRLNRTPYKAETLNEDLDDQAAFFFNEDRNARADASTKTVYLSQIMEFYSEDFLKKTKNLIAYANQYRVEKLPTGYQVRFNPYDWGVNLSPENEQTSTETIRNAHVSAESASARKS
jgi:hypothetical protein